MKGILIFLTISNCIGKITERKLKTEILNELRLNYRRPIYTLLLIHTVILSWGQEPERSFEAVFDSNGLNKVSIIIADEDWNRLRNEKDVYRPAQININDGTTLSIQIARKGNSSYANTKDRDKMPLKIQGPDNFNFKLNNNYRDCTNGAREYIAYKLHRSFSGIAPLVAVTEVYINGEFYGLFNAVEDLNSQFFLKNVGNISHRIKGSSTKAGLRKNAYKSDLMWYGKDPKRYLGRYEFKRGELSHFIDLLACINHTPEEVYNCIDIDQACRFLAVENYVANKDGIIGTLFSHNYELIRREADGLWQLIPWDLNLTFGALSYPDIDGNYPTLEKLASLEMTAGYEKNALIHTIVDEYKEQYYHQYQSLIYQYPDTVLISWVRDFKDIISRSNNADTKLYPMEIINTTFEEGHHTHDGYIPGLIPFIRARYDHVIALDLAGNK